MDATRTGAQSARWPAAPSWVLRADQLLTMTGWGDKPAFDATSGPDALQARDAHIVGLIEDGAVLVEDGRIAWTGRWLDCPRPGATTVHVRLATPAWVECHTHALFAGDRAGEFGLRNAGVPYVTILEAGGGILSTVNATRAASDDALVASLGERLEAFARRGVGVVEVKTGYGLSLSEELRHLELIGRAAAMAPVRVVPTFLGAHAIPQSWRPNPEGYVRLVIEDMLPRVAEQGIARCCDVFCDRGAFDLDQSRRILEAAKSLGLGLRIHAEEITHTGGAAMAARLGARSADHCDHLDDAGVAALAETGCVAVLLPGVTVFLDMAARPPARKLVDAGARVALSTDFNPGSCMTQDLALMTTLGCTLLKLTPGEALWAVTAGAAAAVGEPDITGVLAPGHAADLACFDVGDYRELPWHFGRNAAVELLLAPR